MRTEDWFSTWAESLTGRTVAVTGTTGGLGRELCAYLARCGADLILLDRSAERSAAHRDSLCERFPSARVNCIPLDLEDMVSVHAATQELIRRGIDVFFHNAGAYSIPRHRCTTDYDNVFQINFASPYYMIRMLLPTLRERGGRAVAVGSIAHRYSASDPQDIDFHTRRAASRVYGNAKRYLMFALWELFRTEQQAHLAIVHPGITLTNITAHYPKWIYAVIRHPMRVIFMRPHRAALSLLRGVFEDCGYGEWIGPRLFDVWGLPRRRSTLRSAPAAERGRIALAAEQVFVRLQETVVRATVEMRGGEPT